MVHRIISYLITIIPKPINYSSSLSHPPPKFTCLDIILVPLIIVFPHTIKQILVDFPWLPVSIICFVIIWKFTIETRHSCKHIICIVTSFLLEKHPLHSHDPISFIHVIKLQSLILLCEMAFQDYSALWSDLLQLPQL